MKKTLLFPVLLFFSLVFFSLPVIAGNVTSSGNTWVVPTTGNLLLTVNSFNTSGASGRCVNYPGNQLDINVTVINSQSNSFVTTAYVDSNVTKPNSDSNGVVLSNKSDGNYTTRYTFDQNGTYRFQFHGVNGSSTGDKNAFFHTGSVGMKVSFPINGQTYNSGTTQIITARVVNTDGNIFEGINGTIDINYPNGGSFVKGDPMTNSGDGNYTYTFTVPSTSGTYTFTASFSCGLNSDTNSQGYFVVPGGGGGDSGGGTGGGGGGGGGGEGGLPLCGNYVCERGESLKNCFIDCAVSAGPDGRIISFNFDGEQKIGSPLDIVVGMQNNGNRKLDYILSILITQGGEIEYFYEQDIKEVDVREIRKVIMDQKWVPLLGGSHELVIDLYSTDKRTKFDELIYAFELGGLFKYDVIVECLKPAIRLGSSIDANITYLNKGDFFEDVDISYWVEDFEGRIFGKSTLPVALFPNQPKSIIQTVFIGESFKPGQYFFKARVDFKDSYREGSCSFAVERPEEYYLNALDSLQEQLDAIKQEVLEKKQLGVDTADFEKRIENYQRLITALKERFIVKDFTNFDIQIEEMGREIKQLREDVNRVSLWTELQKYMAPFAVLLLLLLLFVLRRGKKGEKKKFREWIGELLGLDEKPGEHKFFKGKSLIDKLLGLK